MKFFLRAINLILIIIFFQGCQPYYESQMYGGPKQPESEIAVVKSDNVRCGIAFVDGVKTTNAAVYILATQWPNQVEILPGQHTIIPSHHQMSKETLGSPIIFNAEKGHTYVLKCPSFELVDQRGEENHQNQ